MFQPDPGTLHVLQKINSNYRFRWFSRQVEDTNDRNKEPAVIADAGVVCDILDITLGRVYVTGPKCADEPEALREALRIALHAPKPQTPAQAASAHAAELEKMIGSKDVALADKDAEIAALKEQLATAKGKPKAKGRVTKEDGLPDGLVGAEIV